MDEEGMTMAIAFALEEWGDGDWKAVGLDLGEIEFTNESGEKFRLTVYKLPPDEDF